MVAGESLSSIALKRNLTHARINRIARKAGAAKGRGPATFTTVRCEDPGDDYTGTPVAETPDPVEMQTSAITTAHDAAVAAVTDTSDDATVMAADKAVMDLHDAITAAAAVADDVKAGYRGPHMALLNQLADAKADRKVAMDAAQKAADDKARAEMNKASEAVVEVIAARKADAVTMVAQNGAIHSVAVKRPSGDTRQVTDAQVKAVQDRLNARPGKSLGCLTPEEAFRKA